MLADPEALQHVLLANGGNYCRDYKIQRLINDNMLGVGLLGAVGALHDDYRKMLNPHFAPNQLNPFSPFFDTQTRRACAILAVRTDIPVDLNDVFEQIMLKSLALPRLEYQLEPSPLELVGMLTRRRRRVQSTLRSVITGVIDSKLKKLHEVSQAANVDDNQPSDLMDLYLSHVTTKEAIAHTMTFVLGGHETSSSGIGWVFTTLPSKPEMVARFRTEYNKVMTKYGSLASAEAVDELLWQLSKKACASVQYFIGLRPALLCRPLADGSKVFIPQGTTIDINVAAIHRNPKYWANPKTFLPERFIENSAASTADAKLRDGKSHAFYYMPFSVGGKNCIGYRFALIEMQVIVVAMYGQFDFHLTESADLRPKNNGVTLRPVNLEMTVHPVSVEAK
ncbi:Aste57867_23543 [Aphanomyces stellatus]|uniref:Aste57867_23543 protein n=1 Tax=Aphanomyces stellatus TaxID=120398 RepID=A0A485LNC6_9STRA|nr:hypothetical protein As57867_023472 [Aphanomyces stellatus]VFU00188.1 Aste57867_23543 [Aphanomyces stellatus]